MSITVTPNTIKIKFVLQKKLMLLTAKLSFPNEATEPDLTEITSVSFSLLILTVLLRGLKFKKEILHNGTRY